MDYDNRFNGLLGPTQDTSVLLGPMKLDDAEADDLVIRLELNPDAGKHAVSVHQRRKNQKALKANPVATGFVARVQSTKEGAPVARGIICGPFGRQPIVLWVLQTAAGRRYQVKPDQLESADVPDL